jgi:hypothetical protein
LPSVSRVSKWHVWQPGQGDTDKGSSETDCPESEYNKEMVIKYLASMPAGEGFVSMFNGKDLTAGRVSLKIRL